jgi:hypothetical protein
MGLLYEDRCREGLEQGEKVGQALTEAYPPDINGNQGGGRVRVCVCVVGGGGVTVERVGVDWRGGVEVRGGGGGVREVGGRGGVGGMEVI